MGSHRILAWATAGFLVCDLVIRPAHAAVQPHVQRGTRVDWSAGQGHQASGAGLDDGHLTVSVGDQLPAMTDGVQAALAD